MQYTVYRLASFFLLLVSIIALPKPLFSDLYFSILFCHYILAITYSGPQIYHLYTSVNTYLPLLILTGIGILITKVSFPSLGFYFGVHFALSEIYMTFKGLSANKLASLSKIIASRFLFTLFAYLVILRFGIDFVDPYIEIYFSLAILFFLISIILIIRCALLDFGSKNRLIIFETTGLIIMLIMFFQQVVIPFYVLAFYHILIWIMFPAYVMPREKSFRYLFYTIALTSVFFIFTPSAGLQKFISPMDRETWFYFSILFGYVHITSSFALSAMNPSYIRRWFFT